MKLLSNFALAMGCFGYFFTIATDNKWTWLVKEQWLATNPNTEQMKITAVLFLILGVLARIAVILERAK